MTRRNIRLLIEYDGTAFHGWQIQPDRRTVQGTFQGSLRTLLQEDVTLIAAGRTDAGVHALGQVASFHSQTRLNIENIQNGLNALLPDDIIVRLAEVIPDEFHARYDARRRIYRYRISRRRRAIGRAYVWSVSYDLNADRMQEACAVLIGPHDFSSFRGAASTARTSNCTVFRCEWTDRVEEIHFEIEADRFLHNMVRIIVGTSVDIGRGKNPPAEMADILAARDRRIAGRTAPARGLCLLRVEYCLETAATFPP